MHMKQQTLGNNINNNKHVMEVLKINLLQPFTLHELLFLHYSLGAEEHCDSTVHPDGSEGDDIPDGVEGSDCSSGEERAGIRRGVSVGSDEDSSDEDCPEPSESQFLVQRNEETDCLRLAP